MKEKLAKITGTVLSLFICFGLFTPIVQAADTQTLALPVSVSLEGTLPQTEEDFVIKLKAENPDYPMPEGSVDGEYSMVITGEDTCTFPEITYSKVGVYTYTVWQEAGKNPKCTYDKSIFHVVVTVTNSETGNGLELTTAVYKNNNTEKQTDITFTNYYEIETTPEENVKTGDTNNIGYYVILCLSSSLMGILLIYYKRKRL